MRSGLIGILIGVLLTLAYSAVFLFGVMMGVMGTDSCRGGVEGGPIVYLFFIWPLFLLVAAWTPPILHWFKVRWPWVLVAGFVLGLGSIASYILYPIWLSYSCHR